ncbi:MAG: VOC family protein [Steroidobacteraceae bacterium]
MNQPVLPDVRPDHFSFSVPDLDQAIAFWRDIFGFAVEHRFEIAAIPAQGAFMTRGGFRLELWQVAGSAPVPEERRAPNSDLKTQGTKHIAFTVPDAQAAIDALVRRGVRVAAVQRSFSEPMLPEADPAMDAARSKRPAVAAFIQDPAGSLIEIIGRPGG